MARDVFDTFTTHSGRVHDVTDTDGWEQKLMTALIVVFRDCQMSIFNKQDEMSSEELTGV